MNLTIELSGAIATINSTKTQGIEFTVVEEGIFKNVGFIKIGFDEKSANHLKKLLSIKSDSKKSDLGYLTTMFEGHEVQIIIR